MYVPMLAAQGAQVVLEVQAALRPLLVSLRGVSELRTPDQAEPLCDLQVPLLSLPLAFGTDLATIPVQVPYLAADAARRRQRLVALVELAPLVVFRMLTAAVRCGQNNGQRAAVARREQRRKRFSSASRASASA